MKNCLNEGGFSRTVISQDAEVVAFVYMKAEIFYYRFCSVPEGKVFAFKLWHCLNPVMLNLFQHLCYIQMYGFRNKFGMTLGNLIMIIKYDIFMTFIQ